MNTSNIIIGLTALVILGAGGYYFTSMHGGDASAGQSQNASAQNSAEKLSFAEFIKQGGSYKCTVRQDAAGSTVEGLTYIADGMIRGDYQVNAHGMQMTNSMIVRDGFTYSWSSMAPTMGIKTKVATNAATPNTDQATTDSFAFFNAELIGEYQCDAWTGDMGMFTPPPSVQFREI